ncbi:hypothetical protein Cch01nite_23950 [Cellulomonas chitinilytica]|uniref:Uncharacterized protein n=1 Tax=Cellulomonas chitinilytica TaxID=398759 RepID=A0A919P1J2_9CELL|nr:hypothetical protein [Cellulomonas chitinilytica]GIG21671.1 hypothetical protein Cch01nite_23950 [Cellulomonas chitinilytica]
MALAPHGGLPQGTVLTDPVLPLLHLLMYVGASAAVALGLRVLQVLWLRALVVRTATKEDPARAAEIRRAVRSVPVRRLLVRPAAPPSDPYALTHEVVVAPLGDGRPGESFRAPGPNVTTGDLGPDGSRQDVRVVMAPRTHLLVVCLGRVSLRDGDDPLPAEQRAHRQHASYQAPRMALGPVDRVDTAAGAGWRTTSTFHDAAVTDTHVDHAGWAFVIGVLSSSWHARAVEAADGVLATWRWISADPTHGGPASPGWAPDAT